MALSKAMTIITSGVRHLTHWITRNCDDATPKPLIIPGIKSLSYKISHDIQKPTDFCINVEDEIIHVHKSVLCAASEYFSMMLQSGMKESDEGKMHIHDTRADVVRAVIGYFYGKDIHIEWQQIKDYVDIAELWHLVHLKSALEDHIAVNMSSHDCVDWFFYADTYQMDYLQKTATEMIISHFEEISRSEDFSSLSLQELHVLFSAIGQGECNPAYMKYKLNTFNIMAILDQDTRTEIQNIINSLIAFSFILIGENGAYDETSMKVFSVNLVSHTVSKIGTFADKLPWNYPTCYVTDSLIFYDNGTKCVLLDLVTLDVIDLPSFPAKRDPKNRARAVAVGTKVFVIGDKNYGHYCLDMNERKWTMCAPRKIHGLACAACVDSTIFVLAEYLRGHKKNGVAVHSTILLKLFCYDTEKDTWSTKSAPSCDIGNKRASAVVINKDLYYVSQDINGPLILRYSTTEDEWTTIQMPLQKYHHATALSVNGNLVLCDVTTKEELRLQVYDSSTHTWEISPVKLPEKLTVYFACSV